MPGPTSNPPIAFAPSDIRSGFSGLAAFLDKRWFIPLASLACAIPMLLAPVIPLVDLGGHIGRYTIQLDAGRTPELAQWYSFEWSLVPNLGADLLVQLIGPIIGVEAAARFAVILAVALQASGILVLSRQVHGRISPWAIIALPLIYSFPFNFGFINFALSLGLAFWGMVAWLYFEDASAPKRWLVFAAIATVIWVCHMVGWATFCVLSGSRELITHWKTNRSKLFALGQTTLTLSCLLIPLAVGLFLGPQGGDSGPTQGWLQIEWKLLHLMNVLVDRWVIFDQISATFVFTMLLWARLVPYTTANRPMLLAACIIGVCSIVMPSQALGSHYADIRLFPIALTLALLSVANSQSMPNKINRGLFLLAIVFAGLRLGSTFASGQMTGSEMKRELDLIDSLPQHAQLVVLRARACESIREIKMDRTTHLAGYAIARRQAFSNDQWQTAGAQLLRIHNPAMAPFDSDPSQFTHNRPCGQDIGVTAKAKNVPYAATHLWVFWDGAAKPLPSWQPVRKGDTSILYVRND